MVKKAVDGGPIESLFGATSSEDWRGLLHRVIPGGAHTYSKGDDQFPANAPAALVRGEGVWTWSTDGRRFLDMAMGLRSVTLGHAYAPVTSAVAEALALGNNLSRPSVYEAKYAENLLSALRWPAMVKFCKNGSTATSAAVKLARAFTGRNLVARCRQHPFFSYDDWFIGTTACARGVPDEVGKLTMMFDYGSLESVDRLLESHGKDLACLILEPATDAAPPKGFLEGLRERCTRYGIVLIFDEMIIGFRIALGGGTEYFGVQPDLATFGKGMANGFSMAALVGRRDIMEQGDIAEGRRKVFLVSTTHGAEICSLFAAQASLNEYSTKPVIQSITRFGAALKKGFNEVTAKHGLSENVRIGGFDASPMLGLFKDGKPDAELRTLFMQELIERGVLMPYIAPCFSHGDAELAFLLEVWDSAAGRIKQALESGKVREAIRGPVVKPVFREIN